MAKHNLGMVTAYAYAVAGGYTGTEAEFEALLGNIATDLEEIENLTVTATTLPEGSSATASYSDGVLTLGIPKGDTGATGAGATATAGTTTTGNPGTNANVVNSGTTKDAVFDFTIPRGDTGNGIESITLTSTVGAVHTYTITFTDGDTTTFDVTDGEVTTAALTAILADYAKTDGAYESMTVGNAEQLISSVYVTDEEPYQFRTSGGSIDIGDRETDMLVGGTVAWNQLVDESLLRATTTIDDLTVTNKGQYLSLSGSIASGFVELSQGAMNISFVSGHKYLFMLPNAPTGVTHLLTLYGTAFTNGNLTAPKVLNCLTTVTERIYPRFGGNNVTVSNFIYFCNTIDLTALLGSTIADYIYTLETANAGAGVAWFKKLFPKDYYEYNAGELMSVQAVSHDMIGFNQLGGSFVSGKKWNSGTYEDGSTNQAANSFKAKCLPNTQYCFCMPQIVSNIGYYRTYFDADGTFITKTSADGINSTAKTGLFTTPSNAYYVAIDLYRSGGFTATELEEACLNIAWDGERNGEYEEYVKHSYPLDSSLTLRGIPKLDNGKLYYDGDTYESDGTVTRKYGVVDLGTLTWNMGVNNQFYAIIDGLKYQTDDNEMVNVICPNYTTVTKSYYTGNPTVQKVIRSDNATNILYFRDSAYSSSADFKTAMSGVYLVYELATPTTETADTFVNPQIVDDFGTEEYVTTSIVPVGHSTKYTNNLKAKLEMSPESPSGDGLYLVQQSSGQNAYVQYISPVPSNPSTDGTYVLKATVSGGTATLTWVAE